MQTEYEFFRVKRPSSDLDIKSDKESEESDVVKDFSYESVGEEGDTGINTDPKVSDGDVRFSDVYHVSARAHGGLRRPSL
jgi:hypothetical protein